MKPSVTYIDLSDETAAKLSVLPPLPMDLEERFFEGTVQLEQLLACGGAGSVWRVLDNAHVPAQVRALKCIYRNSFSEKHVNEELDILRRVSGGPHVVSILRSCEQDDRVLILMELYDTDLGAAIANQHVALARNHAKARRVVPQLITAVRFCHETANVFHRDIKPENIMLRLGQPELDVVLVDFGLATTSRTSSDFGIGTTQYMTPEAFDSAYNDEPSYSCSHSDLWALGVVLYELLTGDTPWRTPSRDDEDFATFQQDPVSFCKGRSSISTPIQQLLPRIFAPDWRDRMSLEDFAFAVEQEVGDMREPTVSDQELDNAEIKCRWTESTPDDSDHSPRQDSFLDLSDEDDTDSSPGLTDLDLDSPHVSGENHLSLFRKLSQDLTAAAYEDTPAARFEGRSQQAGGTVA